MDPTLKRTTDDDEAIICLTDHSKAEQVAAVLRADIVPPAKTRRTRGFHETDRHVALLVPNPVLAVGLLGRL